MARYIDSEALLELINEDCKYKNPTNEYTRGCNEVCDWAIKVIKNMPTVDVVPKSEADKWYQEYHAIKDELKQEKEYHRATEKLADRYCAELQTLKAKVAREIFEEIEKIIENNRYKSYLANSPFWGWSYRIVEIIKGIAELKKKYTEGE